MRTGDRQAALSSGFDRRPVEATVRKAPAQARLIFGNNFRIRRLVRSEREGVYQWGQQRTRLQGRSVGPFCWSRMTRFCAFRLPIISEARDIMCRGRHLIEAATVLSSGPPVHLVFSDVDLPGATGGLSLAVWINIRSIPTSLSFSRRGCGRSCRRSPISAAFPFVPKPYHFENVAALLAKVIAATFPSTKD